MQILKIRICKREFSFGLIACKILFFIYNLLHEVPRHFNIYLAGALCTNTTAIVMQNNIIY